MKKWNRVIAAGGLLLVVGIVLIGIGIVCGGKGYILLDGSFVNNDNESEKVMASDTSRVQKLETFDSINIDAEETELEIIKGKDYGLSYSNISSKNISYSVQDGQLNIKQTGDKHFSIGFFGINVPSKAVKRSVENIIVYIPENIKLKKIDLNCHIGEVTIKNIEAEDASFEVGIGELDIESVSFDKCKFKGGVGEIQAREMSTGPLDISAGVGEIDAEGTFNGDVTIEGGMGEIMLKTKEKRSNFNYDLKKGLGDIVLNGEAIGDFKETQNNADKTIRVKADVGDINIYVQE